ncbi:MAG TPA: hypothetical protein VII94_03530 [Candidatus Saccharimonadales bacterium]
MFKNIHRQILCYIDKRLTLWDPVSALATILSYKNNQDYYQITFKCSDGKSKEELLKNRMPMFRFARGLFHPPNNIIIHRYNLTQPNTTYVDEICTALHEYGHYISYIKCDDYAKSEVGYVYEEKYDPKLRFKEEVNAWKYGFITIWELPLSIVSKIMLIWFCFWTAVECLAGYASKL